MLLEDLCNAIGVSGDEHRVRQIIKEEIKAYCDDLIVDSMGNLLAFKKGIKDGKTVMLSAHTDEVGFIISGFTKEGYLKFKTVGGIDERVLISKKVLIGDKKIKGVMAIKAIHLTNKKEREDVIKQTDLYIDIGAKDEEDAKKYVQLGDYAGFDTKFEYLGKNTIKAKALDDRVGCYVLCELIKEKPLYDTWFCFVVQEEVGLRGAKIAADRIDADICLVVEGTTCCDGFGAKPSEYVTKMGDGAAISFMDRSTIVCESFYKKLYEMAQENGISVQFKKMASGGNDAGVIHLTKSGIKTASVSVPCRYIHSPTSLASVDDIESVKQVTKLFLQNIDKFMEE